MGNEEWTPVYTAAPAPQAQPATSDEWLANCPQEVRDFANKLKAVPQPAQDVPETNFGNTPATFAKWLQREMPAGTVIGDPAWWAPRIYKAARNCMQSAQPVAQPLSEVEIGAIWANTLRTTTGPLPTVEFARAIEAAIREVK